MFTIVRQTEIRARAATVYGIIADIARYRDWNPWNVRGEGTVAAGAIVRITNRMGRRELRVDHRVLDLVPDQLFRWGDLGWFTWLAYGETVHLLEEHGDHVRHRVELSISGPMAWFVRLQLRPLLERGLTAETVALKARAEAQR
jgi:hypothetical protein